MLGCQQDEHVTHTSPDGKNSLPCILDVGFICSHLLHAPSPFPIGRARASVLVQHPPWPPWLETLFIPSLSFPCPSAHAAEAHRMFSNWTKCPIYSWVNPAGIFEIRRIQIQKWCQGTWVPCMVQGLGWLGAGGSGQKLRACPWKMSLHQSPRVGELSSRRGWGAGRGQLPRAHLSLPHSGLWPGWRDQIIPLGPELHLRPIAPFWQRFN